jgi:hypothetical protein
VLVVVAGLVGLTLFLVLFLLLVVVMVGVTMAVVVFLAVLAVAQAHLKVLLRHQILAQE